MKYILTVFLLFSCAHYPDVRIGAGGIHRVVIHADTPQAGTEEAIRQAHSYCGTKDKEAAIQKENIQYIGTMPESDYLAAKSATRALSTLGSGLSFMGNGRTPGKAMKVGSATGDSALGNPYKVEMQFSCTR